MGLLILLAKLINDGAELTGSKLGIKFTVNAYHGGQPTSSHASDGFNGEKAIGSRLAVFDAEKFF